MAREGSKHWSSSALPLNWNRIDYCWFPVKVVSMLLVWTISVYRNVFFMASWHQEHDPRVHLWRDTRTNWKQTWKDVVSVMENLVPHQAAEANGEVAVMKAARNLETRVELLKEKRERRKAAASQPVSVAFFLICDTCGRASASRIGLVSHTRTHRRKWNPSHRRFTPSSCHRRQTVLAYHLY